MAAPSVATAKVFGPTSGPVRPASTPVNTKAPSASRSTSMPRSRAASRSSAMASRASPVSERRPYTVRPAVITTMPTISAISTALTRPPSSVHVTSATGGGTLSTWSPHTSRVTPSRRVAIPSVVTRCACAPLTGRMAANSSISASRPTPSAATSATTTTGSSATTRPQYVTKTASIISCACAKLNVEYAM
jgi:hypothetical protein